MAKVKVKKQDTFIDMTAMSDVTVLLLTFFMLTATFKPQEPVEVMTPSSVSETKISDFNVLTILIDQKGKVFLNVDEKDRPAVLKKMGEEYGLTFDNAQVKSFADQTHIGVPIDRLSAFLKMSSDDQGDAIKQFGVPVDSTNNQLKGWVQTYRDIKGDEMSIAVKADRKTPYPYVDQVTKTLVDMKENRYSLVTTLKAMPAGL